jgi:hypothetical protein
MHVLPTKRTSTGVNVQQSSHRYAHVVTQQQGKDPHSGPYSNTWPSITHIIASETGADPGVNSPYGQDTVCITS